MNSSFITKTLAGFFVLALIVPYVVLPQKAEAQLIVHDPINAQILGFIGTSAGTTATHATAQETRESVLNGIAWTVSKLAVQSITKSIVNWINSGFNGSPAFVTDLNQHLLGIGDSITNSFVAQLTVNAKINSPFLSSVVKGIASAYYLSTNKDAIVNSLKYNLQQSVQNDRAFLGGQFSQGGFNGWFAATQNAANNPWGTQITAEEALNKQIDAAVQNRLTELNWGKGFLSWRKCDPTTGATQLANTDNCSTGDIQTPGSVIENQLENSLGTGIRQLELADSFNEIVSALMGQLVNQVLGGNGLAGASRPSSSNTTSVLNQATNDTSATASLQQSFLTTITGFIADLTTYQQNWSLIRNAAQAAKDALTACNTDNATVLLNEEVQPLLTEADQHLSDVATALASANTIRTQANTSSTDSSVFFTLSSQYSALIGEFGPDEFTDAAARAIDSTDPLSTYTRMKQITDSASSGGCLIVH